MTTTIFNVQRFSRLLVIELRNYLKKIFLATGMIYAITFFVYQMASGDRTETFSELFFLIMLCASGALFTSVIFSDMHHPLEHYQYMTLPCSQLERFASKYLLTGPIFLVYALFAIALFEQMSPVLVRILNNTPARFTPFDEVQLQVQLIIFLTGHILFLMGSIYFRNFAVVKTAFSLFVLPYTFLFVTLVGLKVFYFDHFASFWDVEPNQRILPGIQMQLLDNRTFLYTLWTLLYLWLLFMAYTFLKDHEA